MAADVKKVSQIQISTLNLNFLSTGRQADKTDLMSNIMNDIRTLFHTTNMKQINVLEIHKRLQRANPARYNQRNFTKENLMETLNYYQKLSVTYIDPE